MDKFEALRTKLERVGDNGDTYITITGVLTMMLLLDKQEKLANGLTKEETDKSASVQGLSRKVNPPEDVLFTKEQVEDRDNRISDYMISQAQWEDCECGCNSRKPADSVSATWLKAASVVRCEPLE
jgi:uncharacterized protein YcgL (UPF0745 family)